MTDQGPADPTVEQPTSISKPTRVPEIDNKKRSAILHAREKGLPLEEIAELTGLTEETIATIVQEK